MKQWHRLLIAGLVVVAPAVAVALVAPGGQDSLAADGVTWYVDFEAQGGGGGGSWENAFTDLQPALDAAVSGDQIWVATGTYTPTADQRGCGDRCKSFQLKNGVALYGGFDPSVGDIGWEDRDWVENETILSGDIGSEGDPGDNSYHVLSGAVLDGTAVLDGFTVSGGNADGANADSYGGGMHNWNSSPTLANCTFSGNSAASGGGGMENSYYSSPTLTNCTFSGNSVSEGGFGAGGGMENEGESSPSLTDCIFSGNSADWGGGMYNHGSSPTLTDCTFSGNSTVAAGGGMYNHGSSPMLTNCTFSDNSGGQAGGGMYNENYSGPTLANCTFSGNSADWGGGMYNDSSSVQLTNCTFSGNSADYGGGMFNAFCSPTLANCILWGDTLDEIAGDEATVNYSDIQGDSVYPGVGNINLPPQFADPGNGDFHLLRISPCIDAGANSLPGLPPYDFEGDARIIDGDGDGTAVVDMGVDEVSRYAVYLPLLLKSY